MARLVNITGEMIELLRGKVDFYLLRGILPVARKWPNKPKPPYTALQAEAMAVFSLAAKVTSRLSGNILEKWQIGSEGVRSQWTDTVKGLIMKYWKLHKVIAPIALDCTITETSTQFSVKWDLLQVYINPAIPEEKYSLETAIILKSDVENIKEPIYFTLLSDIGERLIAPYIKFVIEEVIIINTYSDISYFRRTGNTYQRWYTMPINALAMTVSGALTANRIYAHPFVVPKDITLDRIGVCVTTIVASGKLRLGIYDSLNGLPNAKILDAGEVVTTTTGVKTIIINKTLLGGNLYWLVAASNSATHAFRVPALGGTINIMGVDVTLGTMVMTHNWAGFVYGILPATFPGWGEGTTINYPAIFVRLSA